jgi:hypothetical protein
MPATVIAVVFQPVENSVATKKNRSTPFVLVINHMIFLLIGNTY